MSKFPDHDAAMRLLGKLRSDISNIQETMGYIEDTIHEPLPQRMYNALGELRTGVSQAKDLIRWETLPPEIYEVLRMQEIGLPVTQEMNREEITREIHMENLAPTSEIERDRDATV